MRLIDADALPRHKQLEAFGNGQYEDVDIVYGNDIDNAPTIEAEPVRRGKWVRDGVDKWIPCSEKLPENGHYYLWCSDMGNVQSDYYWDGFENGMKYGYNIIAWMPLPKPYR